MAQPHVPLDVSHRHLHGDLAMRVVAHQLEVRGREAVDVRHLRVQL
eukprot:CAMPEP_0179307544 /NCGR_PEP_ID=MMETSP0797-20121207/50698_1 /TAXON_ID=47934 /ORGANISM="Dinophysis acuminata, Strain DAEP01" /LENGTH=45 /DNA_ID= /DNA_START= /DNA_END= /DNA_ORIENTATION=